MRIVVLIAALVSCLSAGAAWSADSSVRIARPARAVDKKTHCFGGIAESVPVFSTAGGVTPICSTDDKSKVENNTCCDITSKYFPIKIAGPSQHFGLWLRLSLYPTLCHSVLCQRQCALNGYESCNALGGERSLIEKLMDNTGDCSGGTSDSNCCSDHENSSSCSSDKQNVETQSERSPPQMVFSAFY